METHKRGCNATRVFCYTLSVGKTRRSGKRRDQHAEIDVPRRQSDDCQHILLQRMECGTDGAVVGRDRDAGKDRIVDDGGIPCALDDVGIRRPRRARIGAAEKRQSAEEGASSSSAEKVSLEFVGRKLD